MKHNQKVWINTLNNTGFVGAISFVIHAHMHTFINHTEKINIFTKYEKNRQL